MIHYYANFDKVRVTKQMLRAEADRRYERGTRGHAHFLRRYRPEFFAIPSSGDLEEFCDDLAAISENVRFALHDLDEAIEKLRREMTSAPEGFTELSNLNDHVRTALVEYDLLIYAVKPRNILRRILKIARVVGVWDFIKAHGPKRRKS